MAHIHTLEDGTQIIRDDWGTADIQSCAECDFDIELTDEQIQKVMSIVVEGFDCNVGINWEVINTAIEQVLEA